MIGGSLFVVLTSLALKAFLKILYIMKIKGLVIAVAAVGSSVRAEGDWPNHAAFVVKEPFCDLKICF